MYLTIFYLFLQYTRLFIVEAKIDGSGLPGGIQIINKENI